jgi:hypothetical protein
LSFFLILSFAFAQDSMPAEDPAEFIRDAYHRITKSEVKDFDECRKLIDACKKHIAHLADSDPEGLVALAREIVLDNPRLLESEKYRGMAPPRLEIKSSLMGAVVVIGGESARALLEELAQMVESGDAEKQALGSNPADLLEVPVKFDRMLTDALEGASENPENDLRNSVRFAQEHFVALVLLAEDVPGLSAGELLKLKELAVNRLLEFFGRGRPDNPLAALMYNSAVAVVDRARRLGVPLPEGAEGLRKLPKGKTGALPLKKFDIGKGKPKEKPVEEAAPREINRETPREPTIPEETSENQAAPVETAEVTHSTHMLLWLGAGVVAAISVLLLALLLQRRGRGQSLS